MEERGLIVLGFMEPSYTWNRGSSSETRRSTRLDRGLCDDKWRQVLPSAYIKYLPRSYSGHCAIMMQLDAAGVKQLGDRPFHFQVAWLLHSEFFRWTEKEWEWDGNLPTTLQKFSEKMKAWNTNTFGNVFGRKKRLKIRSEGVQRALENHVSLALS